MTNTELDGVGADASELFAARRKKLMRIGVALAVLVAGLSLWLWLRSMPVSVQIAVEHVDGQLGVSYFWTDASGHRGSERVDSVSSGWKTPEIQARRGNHFYLIATGRGCKQVACSLFVDGALVTRAVDERQATCEWPP